MLNTDIFERGSCRVMADDSKEDKLGTEVGNREKRSWTRKPVPSVLLVSLRGVLMKE